MKCLFCNLNEIMNINYASYTYKLYGQIGRFFKKIQVYFSVLKKRFMTRTDGFSYNIRTYIHSSLEIYRSRNTKLMFTLHSFDKFRYAVYTLLLP